MGFESIQCVQDRHFFSSKFDNILHFRFLFIRGSTE